MEPVLARALEPGAEALARDAQVALHATEVAQAQLAPSWLATQALDVEPPKAVDEAATRSWVEAEAWQPELDASGPLAPWLQAPLVGLPPWVLATC